MLKKIIKISSKLFSTLITVLLAVVLICQVYTIFTKTVLKKQYVTVFGFHSAVVLTGSMSDAINPNDIIITKSQKNYEIGDIVTYKTAGTPVTHRIIEETESGFITKGDANNTPDDEIEKESIIGKVVLVIPNAGKAIGFIKTPLGMLIIVLILGAALLLPQKTETKNN